MPLINVRGLLAMFTFTLTPDLLLVSSARSAVDDSNYSIAVLLLKGEECSGLKGIWQRSLHTYTCLPKEIESISFDSPEQQRIETGGFMRIWF